MKELIRNIKYDRTPDYYIYDKLKNSNILDEHDGDQTSYSVNNSEIAIRLNNINHLWISPLIINDVIKKYILSENNIKSIIKNSVLLKELLGEIKYVYW